MGNLDQEILKHIKKTQKGLPIAQKPQLQTFDLLYNKMYGHILNSSPYATRLLSPRRHGKLTGITGKK